MCVSVHLLVCPCVCLGFCLCVCLYKMFDLACAKPTLQDAEIMFVLLKSGDSTQVSVRLIQEPLPTVAWLYGRLLSSAALRRIPSLGFCECLHSSTPLRLINTFWPRKAEKSQSPVFLQHQSDHSPFKCSEAIRVQKAGESRQRRVHRTRLLKEQQKAMTHHQAALEAERTLRIRSASIITNHLFFHSLARSLTREEQEVLEAAAQQGHQAALATAATSSPRSMSIASARFSILPSGNGAYREEQEVLEAAAWQAHTKLLLLLQPYHQLSC